jgi:hypothetical protein
MAVKPGSYSFFGDPVAQAAAVAAHRATSQAQGQAAAAESAAGAQRTKSQGDVLASLYQQPAAFANAAGQAYGAYSQGLGGVADAMSKERSNWYGANAMAESARQTAASNIGAAGLGAYGSASNSAQQAWAANQAAYMKSAADMQAANQAALSGYGTGRNANLAALGGASALAGLGGPAGGFNATGVGGQIASGSYGGGYGGGSSALLDSLRRDIGTGDGGIGAQADAGRRQIDSAYQASMYAPQSMLRDTYSGLSSLAGQGLDASAAGMNQFYAAQNDPGNRADFSGVLGGLNAGYADAGNAMGGYADWLRQHGDATHQAFGIGRPLAPATRRGR